jgi:hypothetical protein
MSKGMNMSFNAALKTAAANLLRSEGRDVAEVVSLEEEERADGFCETCYYEWTVVIITYLSNTGDEETYVYSGDFSELIRELERNS